MAAQLTADDILPLIAKLSDKERGRLLRLVIRRDGSDAAAYLAQKVRDDEFSSDDDLLSWDAEGWEDVG